MMMAMTAMAQTADAGAVGFGTKNVEGVLAFNSWTEVIAKLINVLGVSDYVKYSYDAVDQRISLTLQVCD
jgi:hypothetical protein